MSNTNESNVTYNYLEENCVESKIIPDIFNSYFIVPSSAVCSEQFKTEGIPYNEIKLPPNELYRLIRHYYSDNLEEITMGVDDSELHDLNKNVNDINCSIAVIKTKQIYTNKSLDDLKESIKNISEKTDSIPVIQQKIETLENAKTKKFQFFIAPLITGAALLVLQIVSKLIFKI